MQSVALRLICEREAEIEVFRPQEYWTIDALMATAAGDPFSARLTHLDGEKLARLGIANEETAKRAVAAIQSSEFRVSTVEKKTVQRHPAPPFTTSTLQQEASRKLGFGASRTMQLAQKLYEGVPIDGETVGLITYMRTDSVTLSNEAITASRRLIERDYGPQYVPEKPRIYKTKAKNAQEAHEAIRPTDLFRSPQSVRSFLDDDQRRLYSLIWQRTVACEMASALFDQAGVDLLAGDGKTTLRATGSVLKFDGFLKLYQEGWDDDGDENGTDRRLPDMQEGQPTAVREVKPEQHFTQPPPRYTEASLVKKMEELGIGRPSTYASTLRVLQDRKYVVLDKKRFVPEDRGRLVTAFLANFFRKYVEYDFTAELEEKLDDVSNGTIDWKRVLRDFWTAFSLAVASTSDLRISQVLDALDEDLGPHFFPVGPNGDTEVARQCPACDNGRLNLKLGKFGAFIGCSNYPECRYTHRLNAGGADTDDMVQGAELAAGPKLLGKDPKTGLDVTLRKGPYGLYVQLGEQAPKEKGKKAPPKPKRASLPQGVAPGRIDLDIALGAAVAAARRGRASRDRADDHRGHRPLRSLRQARLELRLAQGRRRADDRPQPGGLAHRRECAGARRHGELGAHPDDGKPISIRKGRYGPYVKHGRVNATLPKDTDENAVTLEEALALLAAKTSKGGKKAKASKEEAPDDAAAPKPAKAKKGRERRPPKRRPSPKARPRQPKPSRLTRPAATRRMPTATPRPPTDRFDNAPSQNRPPSEQAPAHRLREAKRGHADPARHRARLRHPRRRPRLAEGGAARARGRRAIIRHKGRRHRRGGPPATGRRARGRRMSTTTAMRSAARCRKTRPSPPPTSPSAPVQGRGTAPGIGDRVLARLRRSRTALTRRSPSVSSARSRTPFLPSMRPAAAAASCGPSTGA